MKGDPILALVIIGIAVFAVGCIIAGQMRAPYDQRSASLGAIVLAIFIGAAAGIGAAWALNAGWAN